MLGLRRHEVRLEPHDPDWPQATALSASQVEHVGSTAVPDLPADAGRRDLPLS